MNRMSKEKWGDLLEQDNSLLESLYNCNCIIPADASALSIRSIIEPVAVYKCNTVEKQETTEKIRLLGYF